MVSHERMWHYTAWSGQIRTITLLGRYLVVSHLVRAKCGTAHEHATAMLQC